MYKASFLNSNMLLTKVKRLIQLVGKKWGCPFIFFTLKKLVYSQYLFAAKPAVSVITICSTGNRGRKTARTYEFWQVLKWCPESDETVVLFLYVLGKAFLFSKFCHYFQRTPYFCR